MKTPLNLSEVENLITLLSLFREKLFREKKMFKVSIKGESERNLEKKFLLLTYLLEDSISHTMQYLNNTRYEN